VEKIKSIESEMDFTSTSVREDVVTQVLGKDKPGRVRDYINLAGIFAS